MLLEYAISEFRIWSKVDLIKYHYNNEFFWQPYFHIKLQIWMSVCPYITFAVSHRRKVQGTKWFDSITYGIYEDSQIFSYCTSLLKMKTSANQRYYDRFFLTSSLNSLQITSLCTVSRLECQKIEVARYKVNQKQHL